LEKMLRKTNARFEIIAPMNPALDWTRQDE
jgi:hypothetical protein